MFFITIFLGLTNGLICMSKVFINACCAFNFEMTIRPNGVFELLGGKTSMEPIDYMGVLTWDHYNMYI